MTLKVARKTGVDESQKKSGSYGSERGHLTLDGIKGHPQPRSERGRLTLDGIKGHPSLVVREDI